MLKKDRWLQNRADFIDLGIVISRSLVPYSNTFLGKVVPLVIFSYLDFDVVQ